MIGKYINQTVGSDTIPIGRIIHTRGKTGYLIQPVRVIPNNKDQNSLISHPGGFLANTTNGRTQDWDFEEYGHPFEMRLTDGRIKKLQYLITDSPRYQYDFNF